MQAQGERLRALRDARGLTQHQLSERSGITREAIAKIEIGERRMTGTDVIFLADSLDAQPGDLASAPQVHSYYRGTGSLGTLEAVAMSAWFDDYIEDALFLDRTAQRYGIE